MSSTPQNDIEVDWPDQMEFNGNMVEMFPDGPTDFGIGPHARSGPEAIGGCDMEYSEAAARGYMYQPDDPRDIEYKMEMVFHNIDSGLSISADTARHTSDNCCQGNAYMANLDSNADGGSGDDQFRFRKEQWHVHYVDTGWFNHPDIDFSIQDHGKIGYGFCRYNVPDTPGHVMLEMWLNPTPDTNKNNWIKIGEEEDFVGHGFGDAGDVCGGADDEPLTWGGPQSRTKSNSTGGSVEFTCISLREIDPSRDFDDPPPPPPTCPPGQVWNGTACVPSTGGGGGTPPPTPGGGGTVQPIITYCAASSQVANPFSTITTWNEVNFTTMVLSEEIIECMINPDRFKRFGNYGWVRDIAGVGIDREGADIGDRPCDYGISLSNVKIYPSGLAVETYWSESDQVCVCPGVGNGSAGGPTTQDTVLIYAVIGTSNDFWDTDIGGPNMAQFMETMTHEIVESITDPIPGEGWYYNDEGDSPEYDPEISDICDVGDWYGPGNDLWVQLYWSNSDDTCVAPGLPNQDSFSSGNSGFFEDLSGALTFNGDRVLDSAKIFLIFWGSNWRTRTSYPTDDGVINLVRDKLLGTHVNYFNKLTQYDIDNAPVWGGAIYNETFPAGSTISDQAIYDIVVDSIAKGLTPRPEPLNQNVYIVIPPVGKEFTSGGFFGYHNYNVEESLSSITGSSSTIFADLIDNNGIKWLQATGEIIAVPNSRDNPDDFRWSHDMEGAGEGYEVTWIVNAGPNINLSNGHTALKHGGPNHSGDCGGHPELKEGSTCCCWYDIGIRSNGDVQTQIERPHPQNFDWDCNLCEMDNIGINMDDNPVGMKLIQYPEKPGGTAEDGGIRIKFYVDTDPLTGSVPNNNWELVLDMVDHGEILGNYDYPLYQEIEMRLSGVQDIGDIDMYKDNVFIRRMTGTDPGTGGGGGGNTDGIYNHGGRMMHNPKLQVIFWGADWNSRSADPTKAQVIDHLQNKLLATNDEFFDKLAQYGTPGVPTWLTPVVNTTVTYPADGSPTVAKLEEVIKQSLESGLCPVPTDFLNTIFVVLPEVNRYMSIPFIVGGTTALLQDIRYRDCFKPILTLPGGGGGGGTGNTTTVQGVFKFMRDIDVIRVSACAGATPEGGGGGGGGSGTSVFYDVSDTANEKELADSSSQDNRTRIVEKVNTSGAVMNGQTPKQADVLLRKDGSAAASPTVSFKIWDNANTVVYTSPTTFAPNTFTTSFVAKTFDMSTNTHALVVGDKCGVEYTGTDANNDILIAYSTSEGTGSAGSYVQHYEAGVYENQTGRRLSMKLYS